MYNDIFNHKLFVPGIRWITPVYVTLKIQPVALETKRSLMNTAAMISQNSLESDKSMYGQVDSEISNVPLKGSSHLDLIYGRM